MATAIFLANNLQGARDSDAITLDAVENFTVTENAKITSHPVEDGTTTSDHYFLEPTTASFSGVISPWNFTGQGTDATPEEFIRSVKRNLVGKVAFDLFLSDDLQSIPSCLITKFEYRRSASEGKSILVDVDVQQIQIVRRARQVDIDDLALADSVSEQGQNAIDEGDATPKTSALERAESFGRVIKVVGGGLDGN